jgi:cytochrome c553
MKRIFLVLIFLYATRPLADGNAQNGKAKASTCTACHGEFGLSPNDQWPNLAGQKEYYLSKELHMFRDGERINPLMSPVSKMLSDQDIADLSAYFAHLKGEKPQ